MRLSAMSNACLGLGALTIVTLARPAYADETAVGAGGPLFFQVNGGSGGYLSSFQAPSYEVDDINLSSRGGTGGRKMMGAPKIGEATAVFDLTQGGGFDWLANAWQGGPAGASFAVALADQDYNIKRGLELTGAVITGIEWPALKASDGKKHFEVTAKLQAQSLRFTDGRDVKPPEQSADRTFGGFTVTLPGFESAWITSIGLPKITPKIAKESHGKFRSATPTYEGMELGTIKIEIGAAGYKAAKELAERVIGDGVLSDDETFDILIDMKDQSLKKTLGTFTLVGCGLKKFDWAPKLEGGKEGLATSTLEFMVEDFRYKVDHK